MGYLEFCGLLQCKGKGPPCTGLLDDPMDVLADRSCWPSHICYDVLRWSAETWAIDTKINVVPGEDVVGQWQGAWPLPIGKQALKDHFLTRYFEDQDHLLNLVPFDGEEEALWALRIEKDGAFLDLFGLADYKTDKEIEIGDIVVWDEHDESYMQFYGRPHHHECEVVCFEEHGADNQNIAVVNLLGGMNQRMPVDQRRATSA